MELVRDLVHVRVAGRRSLLARVVSADETMLITTPTDEEGGTLGLPRGATLDVGFVTKEGLEWWAAVSLGEVAGRGRQLHEIKVQSQSVRRERREHPRTRASIDIEVVRPGGVAVRGQLHDLGTGGLRASVPLPLTPGDVVQMAVDAGGGEKIRFAAQVLRVDPDGSAGFIFGLFAAGTRERLLGLVAHQAA